MDRMPPTAVIIVVFALSSRLVHRAPSHLTSLDHVAFVTRLTELLPQAATKQSESLLLFVLSVLRCTPPRPLVAASSTRTTNEPKPDAHFSAFSLVQTIVQRRHVVFASLSSW